MPRGGWRGGGRPPKAEGIKRDLLGCRVLPENKAWLYAERDRTGKSVGEIVDLAIDTLQASPKKQFPDAPVDED
jgi:hypothetical protein